MTIKGIRCLNCGDIIYSRHRHDFHWCSCKSCAIDGGFDYVKIVGNEENWETTDIEILPNKDEKSIRKILFDDWNEYTNKYGWIKNGE